MKRRVFLRNSLYSSFAIFSSGKLLSQENFLTNIGQPTAANKMRMLVASDFHFGQPKTEYLQFMQEFIAHANGVHKTNPLDCCVINGDIIHDDNKFLPEAKKQLDQLTMPYYVTQGNHDHATPKLWQNVWGIPLNHAVVIRDQVILLATTSDEKGTYLCPDVNWIKEQLEKYKQYSSIYIFLHITPGKWTSYGVECEELHAVFAQYKNIVAVFNGHDHDQDHFRFRNNIPFLFDGHVGGNWGLDYRGYRIVELKEDRKLYTYMMNPSVKLNEAWF